MIWRARLVLRGRWEVKTGSSGNSDGRGSLQSSFDSSSCFTFTTARTLRMKICRGSFDVLVLGEAADISGGETIFFLREVAVDLAVTRTGERFVGLVAEVEAFVVF